jgi:hypothetical protein
MGCHTLKVIKREIIKVDYENVFKQQSQNISINEVVRTEKEQSDK